MNYQRMTKLALCIAPPSMGEWSKSDIEMLVDDCGAEAVIDFLEAYQRQFGIGLYQQIGWAQDMEE